MCCSVSARSMNARSTVTWLITPGCLGFLAACSHHPHPAPVAGAMLSPPSQHISVVLDSGELHMVQNRFVGSGDSEIRTLTVPRAGSAERTEPSYGIVIPPQDEGRAVIIEIPPPPGFNSAMPIIPAP
jgi:hypothetical protein